MKNPQYYTRYIAFVVLGLIITVMPALAGAQMAAPSANETITVPYYCPAVEPVANDDPSLSKPLGVAAEGNSLNPVVAFDFSSPVDIYVAVEASSNQNDLWILGPDGQFRQFSDDKLMPWESGIYTLKKDLLGPNVSTGDLPDDTYYLYLVATPSGQPLLGDETTPYYFWQSSITVLPPYLKIDPPCLQMESTVGSTISRLVTISNPSGSNESYTISYVEAGGIGFSLSNNNCNNKVMQPGSSCNFTIAFTPTTAGNQTVYLSIGVEGFSGTAASVTNSAPPPFISIPVVGVGKEADVSCEPTLTPPSQAFTYGAQSSSFTVTYPAGCSDAWTAMTTDSWIHITTGSSAQGSTVYYAVDQNDTLSQRTGTITVGDQTFTVTQDAKSGETPGTCTFSISPTSKSFDAAGGTGTISLATKPGCEWLASGSLSSTWLSITSTRSGTGSANISYSVDANGSSKSRTGTLTVEDKTFTVTQSGTGCNYYLSPGSVTLGPNGGSGTFTISTSGSSCSQPSVIPSDSWIHVKSVTLGAGGYNVAYTVDPNNSGAELDGSITVNGTLTFNISESGSGSVANCTYQFTPQSNTTVGTSGVQSAGFSVTTGEDCKWTASSGIAWITVTSPTAEQTGNGTVTYSVAANSGSARNSYISVGGQHFNISQAGGTTNPPPTTSISYTTLPINTAVWYNIQGKSSSGTSPENGRSANFYKVTVPSGGCGQTDEVQFWLAGMKANVNMLVADPSHPFTDLDSAFTTYNAKMAGYHVVIGPPYWYEFNGSTTTESDYVTNVVENNYNGKTFYVMIVDEDTAGTSFRLEANCN